MSSDSQRPNLIFLISQPRAGSTMTQKILGGHPEIFTVSEPWLLLHPFYALRDKGYEAEYSAQLANKALDSFLNLLPNGKVAYFEGISEMYGNLYQKALAQTGRSYFLDKTPRYYNIISELSQAFPEASFIILLRNPLAVLCSIISTWIIPSNLYYLRLNLYRHDLLKAPKLLLQGIDLLGERCIVLHYEKLLQYPEQEISQLCERLGIEFLPSMLEFGVANADKWQLGDKKDPYKSVKPNIQNIEQWKVELENPQVWRLVNDYLKLLGSDMIQQMGYSYEQLRQCLDEYYPPHRFRLWNTIPLQWLLKESTDFPTLNYGYYLVSKLNELQKKGVWGTFINSRVLPF